MQEKISSSTIGCNTRNVIARSSRIFAYTCKLLICYTSPCLRRGKPSSWYPALLAVARNKNYIAVDAALLDSGLRRNDNSPDLRNKCGVTRGFTLIELSIVLVIIGLLVGGILVGRDLIKSSEIRAQIKQFEEFKTAANAFKTKYGYLPGDIPPTETAQLGFFTFTGTLAGNSATFGGGPFGSTRYGFGDNSGDIETGETYVFWQHLTEAKMTPGQYGGTVGGVNYLQTNTAPIFLGGIPVNPCTNANGCYDLMFPKSKFNETDNHVKVEANKIFTLVPLFVTTSSFLNTFFVYATPFQEYAIDSKIDDGLPGTGIIRESSLAGGLAGSAPCVIATTPIAYDLTQANADKTDVCTLFILW